VSRILKGIAKPHETSLDEILLFLERKVLGIDIDKVAEPEAEYKKPISTSINILNASRQKTN
jgi:hypothetical protein